MVKTTLEKICEQLDGSTYHEKDQKMQICLQKALGYIDRSNDPLGLTFDKSQERPHKFYYLPRGDYEILGWVMMKNGELKYSGVDVKPSGDGGFVWKGKKFGEGLYFLVRFQSGREVLLSDRDIKKI